MIAKYLNTLREKTMNELPNISVNIWDDYLDGIREGDSMEQTFAYIESTSLKEEDEKECLELLKSRIEEHLIYAVLKMFVSYNQFCKQWRLIFMNLSHDLREDLVSEFTDIFFYKNLPIKLYSES